MAVQIQPGECVPLEYLLQLTLSHRVTIKHQSASSVRLTKEQAVSFAGYNTYRCMISVGTIMITQNRHHQVAFESTALCNHVAARWQQSMVVEEHLRWLPVSLADLRT